MTEHRTAGDQPPHATSAQPAGEGVSIRAGLSLATSVTVDASLDIAPGPDGQAGGSRPVPGAGRQPDPGPARPAGSASDAVPEAPGKRRGTRAARRARARRQAASPARPGTGRHARRRGPAGTTDKVAPAGLRVAPETVVRIGSPASLLALVPQLLGFEPRMSVVVVGSQPPRGRVRLTLRFDLPPTPDPEFADEIGRHLIGIFVAQGIPEGVAVGYGPGPLVTPVADALRRHAADLGIRLTEVLRAEGGRYWSYLCTEPACCAPGGVPYDTASHPVTAAFAAAGAPPVLASREELGATVAPVDGEAAQLMAQATLLAEDQAGLLIAQAAGSGRKGAARRLIGNAGLEAVREAIDVYRGGGEFRTDLDAAWLSVVLRDLRVRDDAWSRMDPAHLEAHLRLWTDLTRRAQRGYVAAPAAMLAFVAWQSGNGALANVALDRALADDPRYSMAILLREVIDSGAPPRLARLPMSPEEVAASYAEAEDEGDDEIDDDPEAGDAEFGDPGYDECDSGDSDDDDATECDLDDEGDDEGDEWDAAGDADPGGPDDDPGVPAARRGGPPGSSGPAASDARDWAGELSAVAGE